MSRDRRIVGEQILTRGVVGTQHVRVRLQRKRVQRLQQTLLDVAEMSFEASGREPGASRHFRNA